VTNTLSVLLCLAIGAGGLWLAHACSEALRRRRGPLVIQAKSVTIAYSGGSVRVSDAEARRERAWRNAHTALQYGNKSTAALHLLAACSPDGRAHIIDEAP
jgi:hypothetical protein